MRNYYTERHEISLHKEQPEILVSNRRQRREQHKILRLCDDFACFGASHAGSYLVGNDQVASEQSSKRAQRLNLS